MLAYTFYAYSHQRIDGLTFKEIIIVLFSNSFAKNTSLLLFIIIIITSLLLTASRAGIITNFIAGLLLVIISYIKTHSISTHNTSMLLHLNFTIITPLLMIVYIDFSGDLIIARLNGLADNKMRFLLYDVILPLMKTELVTGYGLGTFTEVFAQNRPAHIPLVFTRAHSEYLEIAMTSGILACSIIIMSLIFIFVFYA